MNDSLLYLCVAHICVCGCVCLHIQVIDKAIDEGVADKKEIGTAVCVLPTTPPRWHLSLSLSVLRLLLACSQRMTGNEKQTSYRDKHLSSHH